MRDLAFLWSEDGAWIASVPYGPVGRGGTRESALSELRSALHARRRAIDRPDPRPLDPVLANLFGAQRDRSDADCERWWIDGIDSLGLDRCLFVSQSRFETLLAAQCPTTRSGRGLRGEPLRPLVGIETAPWTSFFRRHRILSLSSERHELEHPSHWLPVSYGLFSFDGERLLALNRRAENLASLFAAEQRPLDEADPEEIARFFAEAEGRRGLLSHSLVTIESLEQMAASGQFGLDRRELARVAPALRPAAISAAAGAWRLEFSTLFGWSLEKKIVFGWEIEVSRGFALEIRTRRLSDRIFDFTPFVME